MSKKLTPPLLGLFHGHEQRAVRESHHPMGIIQTAGEGRDPEIRRINDRITADGKRGRTGEQLPRPRAVS